MFMHKAVLRAIGGSVMVALPKPLLAHVRLAAGSEVEVTMERGKITLAPRARPRYTLQELLAQCDFRKRPTRAEREWQSAPPVGKELL
jgi:antitoxin ChpS